MSTVTTEQVPRPRVAAALRQVPVVPLAELDGPGPDRCIQLPVEVCWSLPPERRWFDLSDLAQVRACYGYVLGAAREPAHVTEWVNAGLLRSVWPVRMPRRARLAWEARNPELVSQPGAAAA